MNLSKSVVQFVLVFLLSCVWNISPMIAFTSPVLSATDKHTTTLSKATFNSRWEAGSFAMEANYNKRVKKFIKTHLAKQRVGTEILLGRQSTYLPIFEKYIKKFNLPRELKNVPIIESALNPKAKSPVGARGLWQFMPATARMYGLVIDDYVDERCDPVKSTIAGLTYLKDLFEKYGDWKLALAAYNCGPGRVDQSIKKAKSTDFEKIRKYIPKETRNYISKFFATCYVMDNYLLHDLRPLYPEYTLQFCKTVKIYKRKSLKQIAKETGMELKTIQKLNPSYRKGIIPYSADGNYVIIPIFGEELSTN